VITPSQLREATAWVDHSGVAPMLEARLRPTRRGRPRQLSVRTLLIGLKLAVDTAKTACFTDVHQVLTTELHRRDQLDLGVLDHRTGAVVTLHQVRRLFDSLTRRLDPSRHRNPAASEQERAERAEALQLVLDRLLDATMIQDLPHHGAYAIDGSGIWSWSRGKRRIDTSADPDARWGSKTAKSGGQEPYFGYELHALVRINSAYQDRAAVPCLAERIVISPAATNCVTAVLPTLQRLADQGRIQEVVADRGYSYKNDWGPALRALDITPVLDLHPTQYGARGTHDGARMITGVPHCPATPAGLDTIKRPDRLCDSTELDEFVAAISRRERWAFRRVTNADTTGKERYECPARAGKVRCPLHKPSMSKPLALPTVIHPPVDNPPTCCTQRTITVPGEVDAKLRQHHYWGSAAWINAYARRSRVEGWFGNIKNTNTEALSRGSFRVMGIAKTSLMIGIYAAATNLRLLRTWRQRHEMPPAGPTPSARSARRRAPTPQRAARTGREPPDRNS
jgi:Transposase DDE domain